MRLQLDEVVLGRYIVDKLLGKGGMGEVVRARHLTLGVPVAIKVLAADVREPDDSLEREALLLARVRHSNVVTVLDMGHTNSGHRCLVMEWLDGEDLRHRLKRVRALPWQEMIPLAAQIAAGLQAIHDTGVLHRDLKPANVMLLASGPAQAKLIDFGLASVVRSLPEHGSDKTAPNFLGTPDYASPEQILGGPLDRRSDLYSLGILLFQSLTGELPFGTDVGQSMRRRLHEPAPPMVGVVSSKAMPEQLHILIAELLATSANDRPANAAGVAARLWMMAPAGPAQLVVRNTHRLSSGTFGQAPETELAFSGEQRVPARESPALALASRTMADTSRIRPPGLAVGTKDLQVAPLARPAVHLALALGCNALPTPDVVWFAAQSGHAIAQIHVVSDIQVVVWKPLPHNTASDAARTLLVALRTRYGTRAVWRTRFVQGELSVSADEGGVQTGLPASLQPLILEMRKLGLRITNPSRSTGFGASLRFGTELVAERAGAGMTGRAHNK